MPSLSSLSSGTLSLITSHPIPTILISLLFSNLLTLSLTSTFLPTPQPPPPIYLNPAGSSSSLLGTLNGVLLVGVLVGVAVSGGVWVGRTTPTKVVVNGGSGERSTGDESVDDDGDKKDGDDEDGDKKDGDKKDGELVEEEGKMGKWKWKKVEQIWDDKNVIWADRTSLPSSTSPEDVAEYLFIAKHRVYPKTGDEEGFTTVEINSEPLTEVLKLHLSETDTVYDEKPSATVTEIFTFRENIYQWIKEKKVKIEEMKKEQGISDTEEDDDSDSDSSSDSDSDSDADVNEEEVDTKESGDKDKDKSKDEDKKDRDSSEEKKDSKKKEKIKKDEKLTEKEKAKKEKHEKKKKERREKKEKKKAKKAKKLAKKKEKEEKVKGKGKEKKGSDDDLVVDDVAESFGKSRAEKAVPLPELKAMVRHTEALMAFVLKEYSSVESKLARLKPRGEIPWDLLWSIMVPGQSMVTTHTSTGDRMGFRLKRARYHSVQNGRVFCVSGDNIEWNGDRYVSTSVERHITQYKGLRKINTLFVYPMPDKIKEELIERCKLYEQYAGTHFLAYKGPLCKRINNKLVKLRADGRVMVDTASFRRMVPDDDVWSSFDDDDEYETTVADSTEKPKINEEDRAFTPPITFGFSFSLKEWGEMKIDGFSLVEFDPKIYDHLVMDPDHKKMIRALVQSPRTDLLTDVVQGKGGGTIILAHGPPGTGKTLTAEAIAELLERPLYIVSSGELGSYASELESNLRDTLEVAQTWNAVLLIDEADVFLEARSEHEMGRNSLVSVFLRVLEYFNGVMILTTNRVQTFDEAFLSRFSCALKYPALDREKREVIWTKFLSLAGAEVEGADKKGLKNLSKGKLNGIPNGVDSKDISGTTTPASTSTDSTAVAKKIVITAKELKNFASRPLNGRQVKNITRTAQALAISDNEPFSAKYVNIVIKLNESFSEDFKSVDTEGMYSVKGESWNEKNPLYQ